MTPAQMQAEVRKLRTDPTSDLAWRLPDDPCTLALFQEWQSAFGTGGKSTEEFYIQAAAMYYGPDDSLPSGQRWQDIKAYVDRWHDPRFQDVDLPQIVFCYALGIGRAKDKFDDETTRDWAERWGAADMTLRLKLLNLSEWLTGQLAELGLADASLNERWWKHVPDVLYGITDCNCVALFCARHKKAKEDEVRQRHQRCHLLQSWLDRSGWPAGRGAGYEDRVYPIERFLFRASIGDRPEGRHAKDFEKGLFFDLVQVAGVELAIVPVLVCRESLAGAQVCGGLHSGFASCERCHADWPRFELADWIIRQGDEEYQPAEARHCTVARKKDEQTENVTVTGCGRYWPADQTVCGCGKILSPRITPFYRHARLSAANYPNRKGRRKRGGQMGPLQADPHPEPGDDFGTLGPAEE